MEKQFDPWDADVGLRDLHPYYQNKARESNESVELMCWLIKWLIIIGILLLAARGAMAKTYEANVSAYCPCEKCCGKWSKVFPRRTASGHIIKPGDKFAAAPKNIPFGTWLDIPGYGKVQVLDRGGAIKGNKLDIFFETHKEALKWGRKYIEVKILSADYADERR